VETDTAVLPTKRQITSILELTPEEAQGLARVLKKCLVRYDNLFKYVSPHHLPTIRTRLELPTPPIFGDQACGV
jgi:UDPglucose--hexose-1-phosphate uridylyltransferase